MQISCQGARPSHSHQPDGPSTHETRSPTQTVQSHLETERRPPHDHGQERWRWQWQRRQRRRQRWQQRRQRRSRRLLSLGNRYVMILHGVDSNLSWVEALKNNTGGKLILAQAQALERMHKAGIVPKHEILDNQKLVAYEEAICTSGMTFELVPPDDHRHNMAEKAIQTFKDYFVGVLSGCAPTFPLHLWCQLPPQVERQLLLLRQSQLHSNLSVYAHVYDHHNHNRHLLIPIGMEALVHDKPHKCRTFAEHCKKAFLLGTSPDHYPC